MAERSRQAGWGITYRYRYHRRPAVYQSSPDGRLIYFASTRDRCPCIWTQRLNAANQPSGTAFAVAHLHSVRYGPTVLPFDNTDLFLGHDQILLSLGDQKWNI